MNADQLRQWLVSRIAATKGFDPSAIDDRAPFDSLGLSSTDAVTLSGELEELLGRSLSPTLVYEYPSIAALSRHLADTPTVRAESPAPQAGGPGDGTAIAIVGIACRFPGAEDPGAYWRLLREGVDAIREVPPDRWDADALYSADPTVPGKAVTRWGGFLERIDHFDPFFFGISPGEAERMDPQQRLLLELAYESLEDAGYSMARLSGSDTGVFVGISINEYGFRQFGRRSLITGHSATANALSIAANRVSYFFDLHGPSVAVDTACSSSLTAVHLACQSLRSGECGVAVAGGVNVALSPAHAIAFTKAGVLAADGRCKVFDAGADGYVRGEGGGLVVLKPLDRALADGDTIHCVIRGSAVRQDGRTNGLMAPNREAQEDVLRAAYRDAGVPPSHVQYVEAHGTGTLLGDSMEAHALGAVVGDGRGHVHCLVGSVKSNFGHLEAAAGIAGLIKAALAIRERAVPPSLHFVTPNPHIPFDELGLAVPPAVTPWPEHDGPALAGVSSFGFGGTNVHVVLEGAPSERAPVSGATLPGAAHVLPLAAHDADALAALARGYRDLLRTSAAEGWRSLGDVCAAAARRNDLDYRAALVARSPTEMLDALDRYLSDGAVANEVAPRTADRGRLAFVFAGQGSQWYGMGRELRRSEPVFRDTLEECERALRPHVDWSLLEQLELDPERSRIEEIDVIQPTLFALQLAFARLLRSWGIVPDAVVGHSMGEVAAACVAGALTLQDGALVISARSQLLRRLSGQGGMAVLGLSVQETEPLLARYSERLSLAASNGPASTVVSGDVAALNDLLAELEHQEIFCSPINVDVASHSPETVPLADELRERLAGLRPRRAVLPFISTVTGGAFGGELSADYWTRNLREPVSFTAAVGELVRSSCREFVEIGPHPVLQTAVKQTLLHLGEEGTVLPTGRRDRPERDVMLESLATLYAAGHAVDWRALYPRRGRPVPLPAYPWRRERYWIEEAPGDGEGWGGGERTGRSQHPLLGRRIALASQPDTRVWQCELDGDRMPLLRDHRVNGEVLVPGSVFVEIALAAAAEAAVPEQHAVVDLRLEQGVVLATGERRALQITLGPTAGGQRSITVHSGPVDADVLADWTLHATATIAAEGPGDATDQRGLTTEERSLATLRRTISSEVSVDALYETLTAHGVEYGAALRGVERAWRRDGEALARVTLPTPLRQERERYRIHPALLDGALQAIAATFPLEVPESIDGTYVPAACERIQVFRRPGDVAWSHVALRPGAVAGGPEVVADVRMLDDSGEPIAELTGLRLARLPAHRQLPTPSAEHQLWRYQVRWRPSDWPADDAGRTVSGAVSGRWLILPDAQGVGGALRQRLEAAGQQCALLSFDAAEADLETTIWREIRAQVDAAKDPLRGIIHLWSADDEPLPPPSLEALHEVQRRGCDAALHLAKGLARAGPAAGTPRLWLVTRGAQPVQSDTELSPTQAPLWGLGRTIGFEMPELECTMVDLEPTLSADSAADLLFRQLHTTDSEDQVALRADGRWVPRLVPSPALRGAQACSTGPGDALRPDGTYLITGGLGGLGLVVAGWMVERGARHLVLVGRSDPGPAAAPAVERLRDAGADVVIESADVTVEAHLAGVLARIRERTPPLRGVVHAAGVLENAPIIEIDAESMARVLAPKVDGAWNLHRATMEDPLDFFVLFSSAVSVLGSPGQGNYAAANAFLDVFAHHRHEAGLPALSINWGPWVDVGLVASGEFLPASARGGMEGVKGITPEAGVEALEGALRQPEAQLTVLPFDIASLLELYPTAAAIPFFAEVGGKATHVSRLYARPNLRQEYLAPRNEIEHKLADLWRQTLRIDRVGIRDSFFELGGDSVLAAQIVTAAHRVFGVRIDVREAFQAFTIEELAKRIASQGAGGAILPRDASDGPPPLSFVQERQLFLELLDPLTAVNNLAMCVHLAGPLDLERLRASANRLIERHDTLRTSFDISGKPAAVIVPTLETDLGIVDLRDSTPDPLSEALRLATIEAERPFELDRVPLMRVRTYRLAADSHVLLVVVHHTIADGWSLGVFLKELLTQYDALADPHAPPLSPPPIQYGDFAAWQRQAIEGPLFAGQLDYWRRQLGGELPVLDLPTDHPRPSRQTFAGATHRFRFAPPLTDAIKAISRQNDVTLFMTLMAALQTLLHRWCGQDDILIGTPTAGRTHPETAELIGAFINTLVLRGDLSEDPRFDQLLARVRATALAAYANQDVPFEKLVAELSPPRDLSRTPIFQVLFILQNSPLPPLGVPGLSLDLLPIDRNTSPFDFTLQITEMDGGLDAAIEYNTDLFDPETIETIGSAYQTLLADAAAHPEKSLSELKLMTEAERLYVVREVNETRADYPRDLRMHELFEAQVARSPDAIALVCGGTRTTYRELDERANALMNGLLYRGIGTDDAVGVCIQRSPDLLAALLAVQKAGGVYLPIEPGTPDERIAFMLRDAGARALLTDRSPDLVTNDVPAVYHVLDPPSSAATTVPPSRPRAGAGNLAYVIYTSGSTGQPKGVRVTQRSLVNLLWSMRALLKPEPGDKLLAVTAVSFDIAGLELYLPLISGGTVVLATRDMTGNSRKLRDAIAEHGVRFMQGTPATWRLLLGGGWRGEQGLVALCGGEPLLPELADRLLERVGTLWNVYGPTETTIWSAAAPVRVRQRITIGRPIANTQLYILDSRRHPVPVAAAGELYVGGDGVSPGYLNRPDLTAERFVADPFDPVTGEAGRLFKTGDRARRLPDGSIELLGRLDDQVKIHGFRIELGEVESALSRHPGVGDVGVVVRGSSTAGQSLLACFVPAADPPPTPKQLRDFLRNMLPAYMVPPVYMRLPALPLTPAGKIDRRALAALKLTVSAPAYEPPKTPLERRLAAAYEEVLGIERVGLHDNFFDLGGGSIQIFEIIVRVGITGVQVTPEVFFEYQTVSELAAYLSQVDHGS